MRKRRWLLWTSIPVLIGALGLCGIYFLLRPAPMARTEIYNGIYLTVEDYPGDGSVRGRVMIVEIHWDTPGVELVHRQFSRLSMASDSAYQFKTIPADLALNKEKAEVLINTTLFEPDSLMSIIPGRKVRSLETLVVEGKVSHIHEHSYLLYWDSHYNVRIERRKPPSEEALQRAHLGIGLQGISVNEGFARGGNSQDRDARSFIGVDPGRKILWLIAYEQATERFMAERAVEAGVIFGGQLDGGSSSNLLIGSGARDLLPHTGIRHIRPLGPYLTIQADPLEEK